MKKENERTENTEDVKKDNPEQSQRFVEAAESLETDQTGDSFHKAFGDISKATVQDS